MAGHRGAARQATEKLPFLVRLYVAASFKAKGENRKPPTFCTEGLPALLSAPAGGSQKNPDEKVIGQESRANCQLSRQQQAHLIRVQSLSH